MTPNDFRKLALSLPEAIESAHMRHPDFRVGGRIFATLGYPDERFAMIKLTRGVQRTFIRNNTGIFKPVKGAWGRRGGTTIDLSVARVETVRAALATAWNNAAPKRLLQRA